MKSTYQAYQDKFYIVRHVYTYFYKQHFYKQRQAEIGKKLSKC